MPAQLTYPGVYVQEISSGVRTIVGVATSITAFVGRALRGPVNEVVLINSYTDFQRIFGGLTVGSTLGYAVRDFYLNGGTQSIIVRLFNPYLSTYDDRKAVSDGSSTSVSDGYGKKIVDAAIGAMPNPMPTPDRTLNSAEIKSINDTADKSRKDAITEINASGSKIKITLRSIIGDILSDTLSEVESIVGSGSKAGDILKALQELEVIGVSFSTRSVIQVNNGLSKQDAIDLHAASILADAALGALGKFSDSYKLKADDVTSIESTVLIAYSNEPTDPKTLKDKVDAIKAIIDANVVIDKIVSSAKIAIENGISDIFKTVSQSDNTADNLLVLEAADEGSWGNSLLVRISYPDDNTADQFVKSRGLDKLGMTKDDLFNLTVMDSVSGTTETFQNLTIKKGPQRVDAILEDGSNLIRIADATSLDNLKNRPGMHPDPRKGKGVWDENNPPTYSGASTLALDSNNLTFNDYAGDETKGIYALKKADLFNILCIPPDSWGGIQIQAYTRALWSFVLTGEPCLLWTHQFLGEQTRTWRLAKQPMACPASI